MNEIPASSLVLRNQDLLEQIFPHIIPDSPDKAFEIAVIRVGALEKRALRFAALTCKAFSEPALDVLWSTMDGIGPLFRLIPGVVRVPNGRYIFIGSTLRNENLERFDMYAQRVRQIYFHPDRERYLAALMNQVLFPFSRLRPQGLLPRLTKLHMGQHLSQQTIDVNSWVVPFIPPTLSMGYVNTADDIGGTFISTLLSIMNPRQPHLQRLSFQGIMSARTVSYIVGFRRLSHLQLTVREFSQGTLGSISTLGALSHLDITFAKQQRPFEEGITVRMQYSLTNLSLSGPGDDIRNVLSSIEAARLTSIELTVRRSPDPISECIKKCISFPSLSHLTLVRDGPLVLIPFSFSELFPVRLHYLKMQNCLLMESNMRVWPPTTNWVDLTTLRLPFYPLPGPIDPTLHTPLEALPDIADSCPNLRYLGLGVLVQPGEATPGVWTDNRSKLSASKHGLRDIEICFVNGMEMQGGLNYALGVAISRFIHHIFPFLQQMSNPNAADSEECRTWWEMVFAMLEAYRDVKREQELS